MKWRLDAGQIEVIDDDTAAMYRAKSVSERIAIACGANALARAMISARLAFLHPDWTVDEVAGEVARRMARGTG